MNSDSFNMDEHTYATLDEDFKNNLKFIRPYIIKLTNPKYITSCRVWLEKMSSCQVQEKATRNEYLSELCRQIKNGKIEEPFISTPAEGPLVDLNVPFSSNSWSDLSTISTTEVPGSGDTTDPVILQDNTPFPENFYENKINEQQITINSLKQTNELLKNRLRQTEMQMGERSTKAEVGINMLASEVEYLKERLKELIVMKRNLQASHSAIIMQWEDSARSLEAKLAAEKSKNSNLEKKVQELKNNLKNTSTPNKEETDIPKNFEQRYLEAHSHEICNIQDKHSEVIKYIEDKHSQLVQSKEVEYDKVIKELKESYDQKIEEISAEAEKNCKFRDEEIVRLEKLVEVQCDRLQQEASFIRSQINQDCSYTNEALMEKISFLQTCILKMERLLRRYEKHYGKKLSILSKELQIKENTVQIQLTTQRAQLLAKASIERQTEIEEIVSQLEERYRLLLSDQQSQVTGIRQEFVNIITKLCDQQTQVTDIKQEYLNIINKLTEKFEIEPTLSV